MSEFFRATDGRCWRKDVFTTAHVDEKGRIVARFTDKAGDYIEAVFSPEGWSSPYDLAADAREFTVGRKR